MRKVGAVSAVAVVLGVVALWFALQASTPVAVGHGPPLPSSTRPPQARPASNHSPVADAAPIMGVVQPVASRPPQLTAESELETLLRPLAASGFDPSMEKAAAEQAKVLLSGKATKVEISKERRQIKK